jgi:hypothetical protein
MVPRSIGFLTVSKQPGIASGCHISFTSAEKGRVVGLRSIPTTSLRQNDSVRHLLVPANYTPLPSPSPDAQFLVLSGRTTAGRAPRLLLRRRHSALRTGYPCSHLPRVCAAVRSSPAGAGARCVGEIGGPRLELGDYCEPGLGLCALVIDVGGLLEARARVLGQRRAGACVQCRGARGVSLALAGHPRRMWSPSPFAPRRAAVSPTIC